MTGEALPANHPRAIRFPLIRLVGPNGERWETKIHAAIAIANDNHYQIGGQVIDEVGASPRQITEEEVVSIGKIADIFDHDQRH